ncbi:MAG: bile acid:sodium symporter [Haloferacaceae archaeon]
MPLVGTLSRLRAVAVVALGTVAGVVAPGFGESIAPFTTLLVAGLVFTSLHGVGVAGRSGRRAGAFVATVLVTSYLVVPALVALVAPAALPAGATAALLVVVAAPTTAGSALVWTDLSRGDGFLATAGALGSLLVAPVAVPAVFSTVAAPGATVPVASVARTLALVVGAGGAAAWLVPDGAVSERTTDRIALLAVFLLLYASIAGAEPSTVPAGRLAVVAACALGTMAVGGVVATAGRWVGPLSGSEAVALLYASTLKNLGVSLAVAAALGVERAAVVVVAFYAAQQLASGALASALAGVGRGHGRTGLAPSTPFGTDRESR